MTLRGTSNCGTVRFEIDGQPKAEIGSTSQEETWKTEEYSAGSHEVCFVARGDGGWSNAARSCQTVNVRSASGNPILNSGGMDFTGYCNHLGYSRANPLNQSDAFTWVCAQDNREAGLDLYDLCRWQYNGDLPYPGLDDPYNPYDWACYRTSHQVAQMPPAQNNNSDSGGNQNDQSDQSSSSSSSSNSNSGNGNSNSAGSSAINYTSCPSSRSRISIGSIAYVSDADPGALPLRANPGTNQTRLTGIPVRTNLTILDGSVCADGWRWWQVRYSGITGWVGEVDGRGRYNLIPVSSSPSNSGGTSSSGSITGTGSAATSNAGSANSNTSGECYAHTPPVYVGGQGKVTPGDANRMRFGAGINYREVGMAQPGVTFNVLDGPVCADGYWWWQIRYQGTTGWTVEGIAGEDWIERVGGGKERVDVELKRLSPSNLFAFAQPEFWQTPGNADGELEYNILVTYTNVGSSVGLRTVSVPYRAEPYGVNLFCIASVNIAVNGEIVAHSSHIFSYNAESEMLDAIIFDDYQRSVSVSASIAWRCGLDFQSSEELARQSRNVIPDDIAMQVEVEFMTIP